jgi:uncharacterized coiled-coil DUF342 family protein
MFDKTDLLEKVIDKLNDLSDELQQWMSCEGYDDNIAGLIMYIDDVTVQAVNLEHKMTIKG